MSKKKTRSHLCKNGLGYFRLSCDSVKSNRKIHGLLPASLKYLPDAVHDILTGFRLFLDV